MYIGVGVVTTAAIFHPAKYGDELFDFRVNHADVAGVEHHFVTTTVNDVDAVFRIFVVHQLHLIFRVGRKTDEIAFAGQRVVLAVDLRHHPPLAAEIGIHHQACGLSAFADINIFFRPGQAALRAQAVVWTVLRWAADGDGASVIFGVIADVTIGGVIVGTIAAIVIFILFNLLRNRCPHLGNSAVVKAFAQRGVRQHVSILAGHAGAEPGREGDRDINIDVLITQIFMVVVLIVLNTGA